MNTKIILGLGTSVLLASSLLACCPETSMRDGKDIASCKHDTMQKHHERGHRGAGLLKMFMKLDLSDEQRSKIRAIIKESMKTVPNPHTAFSDTSFDKEAFVKLAKQKREYKLEHRAALIEKVYKVLTASQKKDFKTILDMSKVMQKNKMMKSCR